MEPIELKVARIGNSRGVRLPAATLDRYRIGETVIMEEREEGILLRPGGVAGPRLSWAETAEAMAKAGEDWREWDVVSAEGLADVVWEREGKAQRVAEPRRKYVPEKRRSRK